MPNPIYVALDTDDCAAALALAERLNGLVGGIKLGLEFFTANGPEGVRRIAALGLPVFLDLKLFDIPNTVAGAMRGVARLAPRIATVHAQGGRDMIKAAVEAAGEAAAAAGVPRPAVVAVTVLTSMAQDELAGLGIAAPMADQVRRLAVLAQEAGADGAVASPREVEMLRKDCGPSFMLVVPGIRPAWAGSNDQKRVLSPAEAIRLGADHLVIGRPIAAAADPAVAARRILAEIEGDER